MMTALLDRFDRQAALVPRERLAELSVTIIGIGAIGRQVAIQLAALGVPRLTLIDPDVVELSNVTTQGYFQSDIGQAKVTATGNHLLRIDPGVEVTAIHDRFRAKLEMDDAVFCCVDRISVREVIWRTAGQHAPFWADARMLGEVIRVLCAGSDHGRRHYPTTLFRQAEAQTGACTSRGTIYTAQIAAGLLVHQFTRWLRGLPTAADQMLNLLSGELTEA